MSLDKILNILVIGSGAREHSIGWKLSFSPRCGKLYFLPGNAGTAALGTNIVTDVAPSPENTAALARKLDIGLVIVGPEGPLAEGVVDVLREADIPVAGPTKHGARLETSKTFAKDFMREAGIPTASYHTFDDYVRALVHVRFKRRPLYIKANGLAGGKGAFPCHTAKEAEDILKRLMQKRELGEAGAQVVIEEFLEGPEISVHAFCDGLDIEMAPATQDHKRLLSDGQLRSDGTNPNTGGMGAYGPVPWVSEAELLNIERTIVEPVMNHLAQRNGDWYTGILYPGLMMTSEGPKVLEFNVRGGDPEMQVLMRLLKSDAVDLFEMVALGRFGERSVEWHKDRFVLCVTLAASGYPEKPRTGDVIDGIREAESGPNVRVFHAGTRREAGRLLTNGGRVLSVTATGPTLEHALAQAYRAVEHIHFEGMQFRPDIGRQALARESAPAA